jgi:arginyl-tRNA synthetase
MTPNLFDYFESIPSPNGGDPPWTARAPSRPNDSFDLLVVPTSPGWKDDPDSVRALAQIEAESWVDTIVQVRGTARLRLSDDWVQHAGAELEAGDGSEATFADLLDGQRFSVQFWDANATKALHIGHLRNLAIGNALAAALVQAGGQVERRSRISDVGRAMGEAMAGVMQSGSYVQGFSDGDQKSDHFVGACYADYVAAAGAMFTPGDLEQAEDSLAREVQVRDDAADDLIKRVLGADGEALELWSKTRAWVIGGQRKTLARLGIAFDRVLFESDFLQETADLVTSGLRDGVLTRRADGVIVYGTDLRELEEMALVRADGLATQHLRSLTYCMTAPELDGMTSLQVTGSEWVSHVAAAQKLAGELRPGSDFHPSRSIFHGMVANQKRALSSSAGALLIDEVIEWLDAQIDADPKRRAVRDGNAHPEQVPAQVALGYFLHHPVAPDIDFDLEKLLGVQESVGWDLARARAHHSGGVGIRSMAAGRPADDPDYRFAVVQSELYRRYLRLAVERLDIWPLAHYLKRLAGWYLQGERSEPVERVVGALLDRSARGLGLEVAP